MSDNIFSQRFFGFKDAAWHSKGIVSQDETTAAEAWGMLTPYWFEKRPVSVFLNGSFQETKDYAIVRSATPDDPAERITGYCGKGYQIVQPDEICNAFDENVRQPVATLGALGKGEKLFLTWKLPQISVENDKVDTFGFVAAGYDGLFGVSLYLTTVRVVCENTWMMAISEAERADNNSRTSGYGGRKEQVGRVWSGRHNNLNIGRDLGAWLEHVQQRAEVKVNVASNIFNAMAKVAITDNSLADQLFRKIYPDPKPIPIDFPESLRAEKQEKIDEMMAKVERDRQVVESLFSGQGTAIDATAWGIFNAVTEYENHVRAERKPAEVSVLFGSRAKKMDHAFNVITEWMGYK